MGVDDSRHEKWVHATVVGICGDHSARILHEGGHRIYWDIARVTLARV